MEITEEIAIILKSYVYVYIDPRNGAPFYIGKGKGNRLFSHLNDHADTKKVAKIAEIRRDGSEPQIDILRHGLSDSEAALVEAASIDLLGKDKLTNLSSGYHGQSYPRIRSQDIIAMLAAKPVEVRHKAILITINKLFRSDMTPLELYETTRGIWVVGARKDKAEYAMSVVRGVVREVYRIEQWYPAGTLEYQTRDTSNFSSSGRWEFSAHIAQDICDEYVNYSVGKGSQNPIRYRNI